MSETAAASEFDKSGYMKLYQRVKRAKTDEDRYAAEAALREAFPNKRPRGAKSEAPAAVAAKNGDYRALSKLKKKAKTRTERRVASARKAQRAKKKKGRR